MKALAGRTIVLHNLMRAVFGSLGGARCQVEHDRSLGETVACGRQTPISASPNQMEAGGIGIRSREKAY